ncbi:hypothetical protein PHJA_002179000 [Phtheirospermum japonicum]|uniref:Uncharacterized protein n=1 Tax=Phtheirospermum japonicum TaxID=374723 RepID=A0A830CMY3_9LAMI|nr:hypothetical protein PHJA_002179000 [Phtheirospermum japonicum]
MEEPKNQREEEKNPILVFFTNLFSAIKLPFPQKNKKNDGAKIEPAAAEPIRIQPAEVENESNNKAAVVTFPRHTYAPLKLEAEAEGAERTTNPVILWQVYAIGSYYILRWAWIKWNERKGQNRSDNEPPPARD